MSGTRDDELTEAAEAAEQADYDELEGWYPSWPAPWDVEGNRIVCSFYRDETPVIMRRPKKPWRSGRQWRATAATVCRLVNGHRRLVQAVDATLLVFAHDEAECGDCQALAAAGEPPCPMAVTLRDLKTAIDYTAGREEQD